MSTAPTDEQIIKQVINRLWQLEQVLGQVALHVGLGSKNEDGDVIWEPSGEEGSSSLEKSRKRDSGNLIINGRRRWSHKETKNN